MGIVVHPPLWLRDFHLFEEANGLLTAVASGAAVVDGNLLVGTGIGAFGEGSQGDQTARLDSHLVALCVKGSKGCPKDAPPIISP